MLRDLHPPEDQIKIGDDALIGVEGYGSLTVAFPNKERRVTVKLEKVAFVPNLALNHFCSVVAHKREIRFVTRIIKIYA